MLRVAGLGVASEKRLVGLGFDGVEWVYALGYPGLCSMCVHF